MNKAGVDLVGKISLLGKSGRENPMMKTYWGYGNLKGEKRSDSFFISLIGQDQLKPGEACKAELKFKFGAEETFRLKIAEGEVIVLNEGARKVGEFLIQEILNEDLK